MTGHEDSLVFVHGAGSSADFWHAQRAAFPEAHYINLPGHGDRGPGVRDRGSGEKQGSSFVLRPSSFVGYADWLAGFVESEGMKSVVLNGHSMGGGVALELALRRPGWLRGLVLTCSGAQLPVPVGLLELLKEDYEAAVGLIMERSFGASEAKFTYRQKAMRKGTRRQMLRTPREIVLGDYEACMGFDLSSRLGEIEVPTLVIVGEQDRVTPPRLGEELREGIRGSRLVVVEGAGHMLPMERGEEYNRILEDFLKEKSSL